MHTCGSRRSSGNEVTFEEGFRLPFAAKSACPSHERDKGTPVEQILPSPSAHPISDIFTVSSCDTE